MYRVLIASAFVFLAGVLPAADPPPDARPLLTRPGKLLFSEDFAEVPHERDKKNKRRGGGRAARGSGRSGTASSSAPKSPRRSTAPC